MALVQFFQVTSFPASPVANALYFLKRAGQLEDLRLSDSASVYYDIATDSKTRAVLLSGLSIVNGAIVDTDTLLSGMGKAQGQINAIISTVNAHIANTSNPHSVTKSQVGLGNVDNTSDAAKPVSTAQAIAIAAVQSDIDAHEADLSNPHAVTKLQVGLGNADNTSDVNKPVSTAQAAADAAVLSASQAYTDSAVVGLLNDRGNFDASGNVFPSSGGSGSGGAVKKGDLWTINVAGTLGGTAVTAGDVIRALINTPGQTASNWAISENNFGYVAENSANKGTTMTGNESSNIIYLSAKAVYDWATGLINALSTTVTNHINNTSNPHAVTKSQVGLGNADNTSDANKPVSTAQATAIAVVQSDIDAHEANTSNPHSVTKSQVGLSNVDNTSDSSKPVSTAQAAAIAAGLDYVVPVAADLTAQGPHTNDINAGASVSAMDLLILENTGKWIKADASTLATYAGLLAIAMANGTNNNPLLVAMKGSIIRNDAWNWTIGAVLYMSETAGAITETPPSTTDSATRVIGFAINADTLMFDPSPDYITHT